MKQYCRYCAYMVCGDANYCEVFKETYSTAKIKRVNNCSMFILNPIDALFENERGYRPRKQKHQTDRMYQYELKLIEDIRKDFE